MSCVTGVRAVTQAFKTLAAAMAGVVTRHAVQNFFSGIVKTAPAFDADPFAFFQVFVVLEKVGDFGQFIWLHIFVIGDMVVKRREARHRYCQ